MANVPVCNRSESASLSATKTKHSQALPYGATGRNALGSAAFFMRPISCQALRYAHKLILIVGSQIRPNQGQSS